MENSARRRTFHQYRANVLELAVRLEYALDAVVAASYASSATEADLLNMEILSSVPIHKRISTLDGVLRRRELADSYPFVIPILKKLFELRNSLAHSIDDTSVDPGDGAIQLLSMRKGRLQEVTFEHDYLDWVRNQVLQVLRELSELYLKVAPADLQWHEG